MNEESALAIGEIEEFQNLRQLVRDPEFLREFWDLKPEHQVTLCFYPPDRLYRLGKCSYSVIIQAYALEKQPGEEWDEVTVDVEIRQPGCPVPWTRLPVGLLSYWEEES